jgi:hypothetical protein
MFRRRPCEAFRVRAETWITSFLAVTASVGLSLRLKAFSSLAQEQGPAKRIALFFQPCKGLDIHLFTFARRCPVLSTGRLPALMLRFFFLSKTQVIINEMQIVWSIPTGYRAGRSG